MLHISPSGDQAFDAHFNGSFHKTDKERMRVGQCALVLRVKLHPNEPWVPLYLNNFYEIVIRIHPTGSHSFALVQFAVGIVELKPVSMAF